MRAAGRGPVYFPWEVWLSIQRMKPHPFAAFVWISLSRVKRILKKERERKRRNIKKECECGKRVLLKHPRGIESVKW